MQVIGLAFAESDVDLIEVSWSVILGSDERRESIFVMNVRWRKGGGAVAVLLFHQSLERRDKQGIL